MTTTEDRTRLVAGLREAIDLIEAHPELPRPYVTSLTGGASVAWYLEPDQQAEVEQVKATFTAAQWQLRAHTDHIYWRGTRGLLSLTIGIEAPEAAS